MNTTARFIRVFSLVLLVAFINCAETSRVCAQAGCTTIDCNQPMFFFQVSPGVSNCPGGTLTMTAKYVSAQGMLVCPGGNTAIPYLGTAIWQLNGSNLPASWSTNYFTGESYTNNNFVYPNVAETRLTISNVTTAFSGNYQAIVISNVCPVTTANTSSVVRVAIGAGIFSFPSSNRTVSVCDPFTLTADAGAVGITQLQWLRNGLPLSDDGRITGSHSLNLSVNGANYQDDASYQLEVSGSCGAVTSSVVEVFVTPNPGWLVLAKQGPDARTDHRMVYDSNRKVIVLFGGASTAYSASPPVSGRYNDTWEFDGTNWWQRFPATVPPARTQFAMAYDSQRQRVVMFGGYTNSGVMFGTDYRNNDTWEWDGVNWTQRTPVASPSPRYFAGNACCYDSARKETLVFGGDTGSGLSSELWKWDGTNWSQKTWSGISPTNFVYAEMAFDPDRNLSWTVGVYDGTNFNDNTQRIWSWDGVKWRIGGQGGLDVYYGNNANNGFAYDGFRHEAATFGSVAGLIGGLLSTTVYPTGNDGYRSVWRWNTLRWHADAPAPTPPNSDIILGTQMIYDSARRMLVLFGGYSGYITNYTYALHYATAPTILIPPRARTNGIVTTFNAVASGARTLSYQWKRNGTNLINGANISGATNDTLVITNLPAAEIGLYQLMVSNLCSQTISGAASLVIDPSPGYLVIYPGGLGAIVEWGPPSLKLQESPAVTGPWTTNSAAATPFSTPVLQTERYFRVRP